MKVFLIYYKLKCILINKQSHLIYEGKNLKNKEQALKKLKIKKRFKILHSD